MYDDTFSLDSFDFAPSGGLSTGGGLSGGTLQGDARDTLHMGTYAPSSNGNGMAWWESVIAYGATRIIDNRIAPPVVGDNKPGSYAGQNGRTYTNTPTGQAGIINIGGAQVPTWALLGAAVLLIGAAVYSRA